MCICISIITIFKLKNMVQKRLTLQKPQSKWSIALIHSKELDSSAKQLDVK